MTDRKTGRRAPTDHSATSVRSGPLSPARPDLLTDRIAAVLLLSCGSLGAEAPSAPLRDVAYTASPGVAPALCALDVWSPAGADRAPIVVFVHGGSWRSGDKSNLERASTLLPHLSERGFAVVAPNFRLVGDPRSPGATWREQASDVAAAVDWVADHAAEIGGDPARIVLVGYSSGAHLVSLVATDPRWLGAHHRAPAELVGVIALDVDAYDIPSAVRDGCAHGWCAAARNLPAIFGPDPTEWAAASPVTWLAADRAPPPFLVVSAPLLRPGVSQTLSKRQSADFVAALRAVGGAAEHLHAEGESHDTLVRDLGAPGDAVTATVDRFLARAGGRR